MNLPNNVLKFLKDNKIYKYSLTKDGLLDIDQSVHIQILVNNEIPYPIHRVRGRFNCSGLGMNSMINFPKIVYEKCFLHDNKFKSLENAPKKAKEFHISKNPIQNLIGCPETTKIVAQQCELVSLEGIPDNVEMLSITENKSLTTLEFFNQKSIESLILCNTGIEKIDQPLIITNFLNLFDSSLKFINPDLVAFGENARFSMNSSFLDNCDRGVEFFLKNHNFLCKTNNNYNNLMSHTLYVNEKRKKDFLIKVL